MLFNSMIHEKPYHNLNVSQELHGCFQLMLWNYGFHEINEIPYFIFYNLYICFTSIYYKVISFRLWEEIRGTKTSHHGPYIVGYRRATYT